MTVAQPYDPPLDRLLTRGEPTFGEEWPDFRSLGFGPEHVPDLRRMATDDALNKGDPDSPAVWAPVHAWRALGQLGGAPVVRPLLDWLDRTCRDNTEDDYALEELPSVFEEIGPAALPEVAAFARDSSRAAYARQAANNALTALAIKHPDLRGECVAVLTGQMEQAERNEDWYNGFLVAELLDLKAVEAAPAMERAFAADLVDETIAGDWEWVRWELGLRPDKPEPSSRFGGDPLFTSSLFAGPP